MSSWGAAVMLEDYISDSLSASECLYTITQPDAPTQRDSRLHIPELGQVSSAKRLSVADMPQTGSVEHAS